MRKEFRLLRMTGRNGLMALTKEFFTNDLCLDIYTLFLKCIEIKVHISRKHVLNKCIVFGVKKTIINQKGIMSF